MKEGVTLYMENDNTDWLDNIQETTDAILLAKALDLLAMTREDLIGIVMKEYERKVKHDAAM